MYHLTMISPNSYIVKSKIRTPDSAIRLIDRENLFRRIETGLKKKLILISGTAGSGKTSLLLSWLKNARQKAAWYLLDEFDTDLLMFYEYICSSIDEAYGTSPEIFNRFLGAAKNSQQPVNSLELTAAFIAGIESVPDDFLIVLDDFHTISNLDIINSVRFLLTHIPENLRLIILTRNDLPFPVVKIKQSGLIEEISNRDLIFSPEEIMDCLQLCSGREPDAKMVEKISEATAGWGIAVGLAGLSFCSEGSNFVERIPGISDQLSGYLLEEVISNLDIDFLFLLKISAVPTGFSVKMVDYLISAFSNDNKYSAFSGSIFIERLISETPFLSCYEKETGFYKYHDFFRDFLLHELQKENAKIRSDTEAIVCDWYLLLDKPEDALEYAFRSGSVKKITPLLERVVKEHADDRLLFRYEKWLETPVSFQDRPIPELELHRARLNLYRGNIPDVHPALVRAVQGLESRETGFGNSRVKAGILIMKAVIAMYSGDLSKTAELCNTAIPLISGPEDRLYCMCRTYLGLSSLYSDKCSVGDTISMLDKAAESGKISGDWILAYSADFQKSLFTAISGYPGEALKQHKTRIHDIESGNLPFYGILGNSYSETARINLEREEYTQCIELADKGLELAEDSCSVTSIWWSLFTRSLISSNCENKSASDEWLERLFRYERENQILPQFKILSKTLKTEQMLDTDTESAGAWISGNLSQTAAHPSYLQLPLLTAFARYLILTRKEKKAEPLLNELYRFAVNCGNAEIKLKTQILLGQADGAAKTAAETGMLHTYHNYNRPAANKSVNRQCITQVPDDYAFREELSVRETEVIQLLSEGRSNMQIAEQLFISMNTVKTHLKNINGKLGTTNRTQAVHIARSSGLCRF